MTRTLSILRPALRLTLVLILVATVVITLGRIWVWTTTSAQETGLSHPAEVFVWDGIPKRSGGYSALLLDPEGRGFVIASDRQHYLTGQFQRGTAGQITHVKGRTDWPVLLSTGAATTKFQGDLEALARMPDGRIAMGFEHLTRLQMIPEPGGVPVPLHAWDMFEDRFDNQTFEALATLPDGRLLAVMERAETIAGDAPGVTQAHLYSSDTGLGAALPFPVTPGFSVTGADVGPDGCLYMLERSYRLFRGFEFQLIRMGAEPPWDGPRALLFRSKPMSLGNGEGLSVWRRGTQIIASVVTDDGFPPLSPTRLIELPLHPVPAPAPDCAGQ